MQKLTNQEKMKPWMGFVLFFVGVLFLLFAGSYMQSNWGIPGLILTEIGFLAISVIYCLIRKVSLKEVFPIKKITVRDFFGTIFMFAGGFLANLVAIGISFFVLDHLGQSLSGEISDLSDFLYGNKMLYIVLVLVVAVTPAICEEAFMRGAVLSNFRGLKHDWVTVLIIGIFFGILHLSPLRFLNTAILGGILAYIMVKKNNILLPMLVHFLNNFVTSIAGVTSSGSGTDAAAALDNVNTSITLGSFLVMGFLFPLLLVIGAKLYDKNLKGTNFAIAGILSGVMFAGGILLVVIASLNGLYKNALLNWNYTYQVTEETMECENLAEAGIDITEEKTYSIIVSSTASKAEITFTMVDEDGNEIISKSGSGMLVVSENIELTPGHYDLYFTGGEDMVGKMFSYQVIVQ